MSIGPGLARRELLARVVSAVDDGPVSGRQVNVPGGWTVGRAFTFRTPDGRSFRVPPGTSVVVGRGEMADISFPDPYVSRRHCRIANSGDECTIVSLSRFWPLVDGCQTPTEVYAVRPGDRIGLRGSGVVLIVDIEGEEGEG